MATIGSFEIMVVNDDESSQTSFKKPTAAALQLFSASIAALCPYSHMFAMLLLGFEPLPPVYVYLYKKAYYICHIFCKQIFISCVCVIEKLNRIK